MLSSNVLCVKKRKKRSYCLSDVSDYIPPPIRDNKRSASRIAPTMMQITEDTPPDMLAGAMDLTVHLPTGQSVKMPVERSTPMMDLLVQVTTAHRLQPSGHMIEALSMAPTSSQRDSVLPYKPNTPIGALDTQHIRVLPKSRSLPAVKNPPMANQPFESTFRLKVHLPRNQLYVFRVSQYIQLEDIMKKVCEEKNLDPLKYEFRHPANLDEVLNPKLSLSDYQLTEISVVSRGAVGLSQNLSSSDIMSLRKDEEKRQMHAKTGGGVFGLIFKRGRTGMGSGSISSDNRSISPTHSDDSRSVTPPAIQTKIHPSIPAPSIQQEPNNKTAAQDKPKAPQRKRRPAPKPPGMMNDAKQNGAVADSRRSSAERSLVLENTNGKSDHNNGLTICHSRNSSDSSGYHEASVLSDNTLPRRPKSSLITHALPEEKTPSEASGSTGNLSKMSTHSKSTSSLALAGRKKKAAPPPPVIKTASSVIALEKSNPVVASEPIKQADDKPQPLPRKPVVNNAMPQAPLRMRKSATKPADRRSLPAYLSATENHMSEKEACSSTSEVAKEPEFLKIFQKAGGDVDSPAERASRPPTIISVIPKKNADDSSVEKSAQRDTNFDTMSRKRLFKIGQSMATIYNESSQSATVSADAQCSSSFDNSSLNTTDSASLKSSSSSCFESSSSGNAAAQFATTNDNDDFQINDIDLFAHKKSKKSKHHNKKGNRKVSGYDQLLGIHDIDQISLNEFRNADVKLNRSLTSLRSLDADSSDEKCKTMKKWNNLEDLDGISMLSEDATRLNDNSSAWVVGDTSDTDSVLTLHTQDDSPKTTSLTSEDLETTMPNTETNSVRSSISEHSLTPSLPLESLEKSPWKENMAVVEPEEIVRAPMSNPCTPPALLAKPFEELKVETDIPTNCVDGLVDADWQYQLPSPPTAFRDDSPTTNLDQVTNYETVTLNDFPNKTESVISNPELFEKLLVVKDSRSETLSEVSSEPELKQFNSSCLSLETLEKRKSLVYNRELATSLKIAQSDDACRPPPTNKRDETYIERDRLRTELTEAVQATNNVLLRRHNNNNNSSSNKTQERAANDCSLPNFTISTYDKPKQKINIFEDDTIRSNVVDPAPKRYSAIDIEQNNKNIENSLKVAEGDGDDVVFKKPQEFVKANKTVAANNMYNKIRRESLNSILRSESFSTEQSTWKPLNKVKRSKSQITLQRYKDEDDEDAAVKQDGLHKSNSLFDVSGLQSLEVMRKIQTQLNTQVCNNDVEQPLAEKEPSPYVAEKKQVEIFEDKPQAPPKPATNPSSTYKYSGPPAINLGTWSDRPKTQVSLKEDTDYKIKTNCDNFKSKLDISSNGSMEIKDTSLANYHSLNVSNGANSGGYKANVQNVSIKVNGSEPISRETSGNVLIKIGSSAESKVQQNHSVVAAATAREVPRYINHFTAVGYRKPLGNVNKNAEPKSRPHSIAFGADFDISRVPIVRAVELKKPFKDQKSVTHINGSAENDSDTFAKAKTSALYSGPKSLGSGLHAAKASFEPINSNGVSVQRNNSVYVSSDAHARPVQRVNSYASNRPSPVVKGFRNAEATQNNGTTEKSIASVWKAANIFNALPAKPAAAGAATLHNNEAQNNVCARNGATKTNIKENNHHVNNGNVFGNVVLRSTSRLNNTGYNSYRHSSVDLAESPPPPVNGNIWNGKCNNNIINTNNNNNKSVPIPPPPMPKFATFTKKSSKQNVCPQVDPRTQLLDAIRDFGGKKGLRAVKT